MAMKPLFKPTPSFSLPLSKGSDLVATFVYKPLLVDEGNEPILSESGKRQYVVADYPEDTIVELIIDHTDEILFIAEIDGSEATITGAYEETDRAANGLTWRARITYASGIRKVMCNGIVLRADGKG